jgi:hypothetical protein
VILDRRENSEREQFGEPPHTPTRAGQLRLSSALATALEVSAGYESSYADHRPQKLTSDRIEDRLQFRTFCEGFCDSAVNRIEDFNLIAASTTSRRSDLVEAKKSLIELERLFYAVEMDLPRPPHLAPQPAEVAEGHRSDIIVNEVE